MAARRCLPACCLSVAADDEFFLTRDLGLETWRYIHVHVNGAHAAVALNPGSLCGWKESLVHTVGACAKNCQKSDSSVNYHILSMHRT